jgi:hypothetical protein
MSTLQVNSVTKARQCGMRFGKKGSPAGRCIAREDKRDKCPLARPIAHVCCVWLYSTQRWEHVAEKHECRRCGATANAR